MRSTDIPSERKRAKSAMAKVATIPQGTNFHRDRKESLHQSAVAPRAEPSRHGANQWTGGRRDKRKHR